MNNRASGTYPAGPAPTISLARVLVGNVELLTPVHLHIAFGFWNLGYSHLAA